MLCSWRLLDDLRGLLLLFWLGLLWCLSWLLGLLLLGLLPTTLDSMAECSKCVCCILWSLWRWRQIIIIFIVVEYRQPYWDVLEERGLRYLDAILRIGDQTECHHHLLVVQLRLVLRIRDRPHQLLLLYWKSCVPNKVNRILCGYRPAALWI